MSLLMQRGDAFSKLGWKRGVTIPDHCNVWNFFLKAFADIQFDSKNTADFEDCGKGRMIEVLQTKISSCPL